MAIWITRWSQRLPCFLWDTWLVRAGLLIGENVLKVFAGLEVITKEEAVGSD
jgi:hypothetical protein